MHSQKRLLPGSVLLWLAAALVLGGFTGCRGEGILPPRGAPGGVSLREEAGQEQAQPGPQEETAQAVLHTKEELEAMRRSLPYPEGAGGQSGGGVFPFYADAQSVEMADYLMRVVERDNLPARSFGSPDTAPTDFVVRAALYATPRLCSWEGDETYRLFYLEQLLALEQYAGDDAQFYTKEHVAQSARYLFGDEVPLRHQQAGEWFYSDYAGIYTATGPPPQHRYGPVILEQRDLGDRWVLTVVFLQRDAQGAWLDLFGNRLPEAELAAYCRDSLPRHAVTLRKADDGGFRYDAHQLPEQPLWAGTAAVWSGERFGPDDVLGVVHCREGRLPGWSDQVTRGERLVLDEDGELLYLFPVYAGTELAVERLDWTLGNPAVEDTVLYCAPTEDSGQYALALWVQLPQGGQARYRVAATLHGRRVEYLLERDAAADGIAMLYLEQDRE